MRDKHKDEQYFIEASKWFLTKFKKLWHEFIEIQENKREPYKNMEIHHSATVGAFQRYFYSGYSVGLSKFELGENLAGLRNSLLAYWNKECSYMNLLFTMSTAIIYNTPKEEIAEIVNLLVRENYKDFVLDSMANYLMLDFTIRTEELKFKKSSKPVAEVLTLAKTDKDGATRRLKHYLEREWLNMQKEGIIDNKAHLADDAMMVYYGYWCIESAALVIMLGLDDTSLKDCKYYPYDLVHG